MTEPIHHFEAIPPKILQISLAKGDGTTEGALRSQMKALSESLAFHMKEREIAESRADEAEVALRAMAEKTGGVLE